MRYMLRLEAPTRYALFYEKHLLKDLGPEDEAAVRRLFDVLTRYEDVELPALRRAFSNDAKVRVKSVKAHAFLFAPFERFVYLDFDSRPCGPDFARRLFARLDETGADAVLHDQWNSQRFMVPEKHYRVEHNSAVAVFDARRPATRAALRWFVAAFAYLALRRDQPALICVEIKIFKIRSTSSNPNGYANKIYPNFEISTRGEQSSQNQPNRLRFDRARDF